MLGNSEEEGYFLNSFNLLGKIEDFCSFKFKSLNLEASNDNT